MKLIDYMREKGIKAEGFAEMVGGKTTPRAVRKWMYGETRPRLEDVARIEQITENSVLLADFLASGEPAQQSNECAE